MSLSRWHQPFVCSILFISESKSYLLNCMKNCIESSSLFLEFPPKKNTQLIRPWWSWVGIGTADLQPHRSTKKSRRNLKIPPWCSMLHLAFCRLIARYLATRKADKARPRWNMVWYLQRKKSQIIPRCSVVCLAEFVTLKNSYPTRKNLCLAFGELDLPTSKFEVRVFVIPSCPLKKSLPKSRGENRLQGNTADYLPFKNMPVDLHPPWNFQPFW